MTQRLGGLAHDAVADAIAAGGGSLVCVETFPDDTRALAARLVAPDALLALRSDHAPLVSPATPAGRVLTFNVLTRCRRRLDGSYNNGFGAVESEAAYHTRLDRLAEDVALLTRPPVDVAALQEVPREGTEASRRLLARLDPREWHLVQRPTRGVRFAMLTAVRRSAYPEVAVLPDPDPAGAQAGRALVLRLSGGASADVVVANVHLEWAWPAVDALRVLLEHARVVIAGDFNRPPEHPLRRLDALAAAVAGHTHFPTRPTAFGHAPGAPPVLVRIDGFAVRDAR